MDKYSDLASSMSHWSLDDIAKFLIAARERGMHIVYTFNGVDLDSSKIASVDDAYRIMSGGLSKDEVSKELERMHAELNGDNQDKENSNTK